MSASPHPETACPSCGAARRDDARFCPACGAPAGDEPPPVESARGPVAISVAQRRWFGVPPGVLLLCGGFAAFGAAIGLLAAGRWPWGLVLLGVAVLAFGGIAELNRQQPHAELAERSALLVADGRSRATAASQVWRARLDGALERRRARTETELIESERGPVLRELGSATWTGDEVAAERARARLAELAERQERIEQELAERLEATGERIRRARLPVDQTMMVAPNEPSAPYPPPDEGTPPQPAQVPEPYPPPDEGTPPTPAPDPDRD